MSIALLLGALAVAPAAASAATLALVGQTNLGGGGLNGQVTTIGNTAIVASGILAGSGLRSGFYSGPYTCPQTTVKIVDVSTPTAPVIKAQIPVPLNAVANDVSALHVNTPSFSGDLLAVALVRCNGAGNYVDRGVAYYNITTPASPVYLGRYQADANQSLPGDPPCTGLPSNPSNSRDGYACASSQDQVSLVQRPDGRVLSLSTEPFSSASQGSSPDPTAFHGDLRIVDVTNPTTPTEIGSYPNEFPADQRPPGFNGQPVGYSNNGCRAFDGAIGVGSYPDGSKALLPGFDQGLFTVDLSNPAAPSTLGQYQYPRSDRTFEGNASYVNFASVGGHSLALLGESDWIAPSSTLRIDGTSSVAGSKFACEAMFTLFDPNNTAQVYRHPGSQVPGGIVYVGRACPASGATAADPYPTGVTAATIAGKIVLRDRAKVASREGSGGVPSCSVAAATLRLQADGAVGVIVGNTSTTVPQATSFDGDPTGVTIPTFDIDTGDATALRDYLCPAPAVAPGAGVTACAPGGQALTGGMVDSPGPWGALRVVDVSNPAAPTLRGSYQPPPSLVFPPPDLGVYSVHHAVARGSVAFVAAHANGVRVIDLTSANPTEIASFVPPDTPDPTNEIPAKANVTGVDVAANGAVVVSDTNSGLYVLELRGEVACSNLTTATAYGTAASVQLSCTDPGANTLSYSVASTPSHGTLSAPNAAGQVTYTPTGGYSGGDSFSYLATAADGTSNTATVSIAVAKAAFGHTANVVLSLGKLKPNAQGVFAVKLHNGNAFTIEATSITMMSLNAITASKKHHRRVSFLTRSKVVTLEAGKTVTITLHLTHSGLALLKRLKHVRVDMPIMLQAPDGGGKTITGNGTLHAPRVSRKKHRRVRHSLQYTAFRSRSRTAR
ncbi:MAG: cadherin-like domain-containing protein [Actinomycetota bacterium]|nr:cadherin-like domain-containing protein [Actinomycetota bacterium]